VWGIYCLFIVIKIFMKMANDGRKEDWPDLTIGLYDKLTGRKAKIA
jgi:hypothetical protein